MSESCEFPVTNADDAEVRQILALSRVIAIVGMSDKPERDSYMVARYMINQGYTVIPVNPNVEEILGQKCYSDLCSIPVKVDIVDIFRKPEAIPAIVDDAIKIGASTVWMQLGLAHNASADKARAAGLNVVMSKCIKVEHHKLLGFR